MASAAVIDLHCHLLPALDDGPAEEQASIALARRLVEDGVRIAAATPHLRSDHPDVAPAELAGRCRALEDRCADEGVPLRIVPGGEVDLLWAQSASAEDLALASYGQRGSDLLVETPYGPLPRSFERLVSELQEAGFRILLAHPERSPTFQQDPQRLAELVARAVLVQVTASSLVGNPRRSRSTGLARALVEERLAHVIASDSHDAGHSGRASLADGVEAAGQLAPARSLWMVTEAPEAILSGDELPAPPADRPSFGRRLRYRSRASRGLRSAR